jgi:hypothetical protein
VLAAGLLEIDRHTQLLAAPFHPGHHPRSERRVCDQLPLVERCILIEIGLPTVTCGGTVVGQRRRAFDRAGAAW